MDASGDSTATTLARELARAYPWPVSVGDDLRRSAAFLGVDVDAETVVRAGYVAAVPASLVVLVASTLLAPASPVVTRLLLAVTAGLAATHAVHRLPVGMAALRRTRALGETADLVGRAALRMRLEPTPERAALFATRTGDGPLSESLESHVRRARGAPESALESFAEEWSPWFPAVDRSVSLLLTSADAAEGERSRSLDRALEAVLDGTHDEMADFASTVRGPTTALYAFGVLLPLALVGVLPAARAAGLTLPTSAFVFAYNVFLPLVVVAASAWLLVRRPVALPPPRVGSDHPDVTAGPHRGVLAGLVGVAVGWVGGGVVASWASPVAAAGFGLGASLAAHYYPMARVRRRVRDVESRLDDALYLVGRRVDDGTAVETAVEDAADDIDGATGEMLSDAAGVRRRLRVGVREAFLGEYGALADVPSPRTRGAAALLAVAATEGRPAGGAIVATADHLRELRRVEREARRQLSSVTGTLANTAAFFAPLVAGATVAMAARMAETDLSLSGEATALSTGTLGVSVGAYALCLAGLLTMLSTGLDRGLDRTLVGYRVGLALLAATGAYLAAFAGASLLF
ncbi:type II secretion system protein [Halopelagius longus]|uniref:Flp pilus assembly protein TadB n=1 Tax=Halopelagius longus TaxID=1236180 RepID=A0A1H1DB50_9EURY|nr:type II secretion system protein [Halopelagius longus]RDI71232.1 type II secretion system protein [Halopelagius longus]SDQ73066.1 Flp pilus assembly protein TadB [Halopelagius longus]